MSAILIMIAIPMALAMMVLVIVTVGGIQNLIVQVINSIMIECTRSYLDTTFGSGGKSNIIKVCVCKIIYQVFGLHRSFQLGFAVLKSHVIRISVMVLVQWGFTSFCIH